MRELRKDDRTSVATEPVASDADAAGSAPQAPLSRRRLLVRAGLGLIALGAGQALRGGGAQAAATAAAARPDLDAARKEGPLVVLHGDQEADVVKFLNIFTQKTGIKAKEQRLLPGAALPKLDAEIRTGTCDTDVYNSSDSGLLHQMQTKKQLLRYDSPEIAAYAPVYRSDPVGYWTTYFINLGPMMYDAKWVKPGMAPKTWTDLLDPRWKGQIGFQNSAAGSQYAWWYLLKDVLPADYWDRLAKQKPRAYASSTQMMTDVESGNLLIGGKVSIFQYVKAERKRLPVNVVFPPEGTPAQNQVTGIIVTTKRPNAAKIFVDYLLSAEGQRVWNDLQGSPSARPGIKVAGLPDLSKIKILVPTNFADYAATAQHARFVALWNKVTGL